MVRIFIYIVSIFIFCSCKIKFTNSNDSSPLELYQKDSFTIDIPPEMATHKFQEMKNKMEQQIGISNLQCGCEGLQIRLWYGYVFKNQEQLVILKNEKMKWIANLYTLTYQYNPKNDSTYLINIKMHVGFPKSGWSTFMNDLLKQQILTLPDYRTLNSYYLSTDADGITVEICKNNMYRTYAYADPISHKNAFIQAMNISHIMDIVETELEFSRLRKF